MSNINRLLEILSEGKDDIISNELFAKAQKLGMTRDEISKYSKKPDQLKKLVDRKQEANWKKSDSEEAKAERKAKRDSKPKLMSDAQFRKMCKDAAADWKADNDHDGGEQTLDQVAHDMADSMLYNPDVLAYVKHKLGNDYSKQNARDYVADSIHG